MTVLNADNMNELLAQQSFEMIYEGSIVDSKTGSGVTENSLSTASRCVKLTGITGSIKRAELEIDADGTGADLTVQIRSGMIPGSGEDGTLIKQVTVPKEFIPAAAAYWSVPFNVTLPNLLTANQASVETNTTGFTALGSAVLTRDTSTYWDGAACLKAVTPNLAIGEGFYANKTGMTLVVGDVYTASAYVKGSGTLRMYVTETNGGTGATTTSGTLTLSSSWQRLTLSHTITDAANTEIRVQVKTPTQQGITFYSDGLQLELAAAATTWHLPQTAWLVVVKAGDATNENDWIGEASQDGSHPAYYRTGSSGAWSANNALHYKVYAGNTGELVHGIFGTNLHETYVYNGGELDKVYRYLPPSDGAAGGIRDIITITFDGDYLTGGAVT